MFKVRLITLIAISVMIGAHITVQASGACLTCPPHLHQQISQPQSDTAMRESSRSQSRLVRRIRNELVTLPYYGVFDWLEGEARPDGTVVLRGQVVRASTKSEAEARVKDIEGIEQVINEIEVLPVSPNDERLRVALYRALFNQNSPLFRYAFRSVPPIHIIVNKGRATLKGVVATEQEKQLAYTRARAVPGLFEVRNELVVEKEIEG